jgi:hypothetical protein
MPKKIEFPQDLLAGYQVDEVIETLGVSGDAEAELLDKAPNAYGDDAVELKARHSGH